MGVDLTSLSDILGGLSVGVGLALRPIILNFVSGIIMLIEHPISVGDTVDVASESSVVTSHPLS